MVLLFQKIGNGQQLTELTMKQGLNICQNIMQVVDPYLETKLILMSKAKKGWKIILKMKNGIIGADGKSDKVERTDQWYKAKKMMIV